MINHFDGSHVTDHILSGFMLTDGESKEDLGAWKVTRCCKKYILYFLVHSQFLGFPGCLGL